MRWPLRRQILWPLVGVMLATIAIVSGLNAWLATRRIERQIESQLRGVVETLAASNFPLEASVLRQMRGLTSAEYAVSRPGGLLLAASDERLRDVGRGAAPKLPRELRLSQTVWQKERSYFYVPTVLDRRPVGGERFTLHIFYPEANWEDARRQAIIAPLAIGAAAIAITSLVASAIAAHVTRPVQQLKTKVEQIAAGDFQPLELSPRDDEIRDLTVAVNQLAAMLVRYEAQVRTNERLRTLGQLGGGIAHQVRNAATGCRIALDLHQRDCPRVHANGSGSPSVDETLQIAVQQLALIETHVQRFLTLGRKSTAAKRPVQLSQVIDASVPLVRPMADHVGVRLEIGRQLPGEMVVGDLDSLQQLLINLLLNGIEAAAHARAVDSTPAAPQARVQIEIRRREKQIELAIGDTGAGPSTEIQSRLFEPFATDKPQGTGLGLSVVRQIAEDHSGSVRWERTGGMTWFLVTFDSLPG